MIRTNPTRDAVCARYADTSVQITRPYSRDDLHRLSDLVSDQLPNAWTHEHVVDTLDGTFASGLVPASKSATQ